MTAVSAVALVTISLFIVIQLFHFVHQRREDYARQLESIAYSVRQPLTEAVLQGEVQRAEDILNNLLPAGFLSRADVLLPDEFQTLHANFPTERPVPGWIARVFKLPIRISVPLYSPPQTQNTTPLANLVLQADSYRMFQFIVSTFSTMLATYLLLALILSIAITWCMNRLMVHPLRAIIAELQNLPTEALPHHQLTLPEWHQDDELGVLVRSYNRNQQWLEQSLISIEERYDLPGKDAFLAQLQQCLSENIPLCLMVLGLEPPTVAPDKTRDAALHTLVNQLKSAIEASGESVLLACLNSDEFAMLRKPLPAEQIQNWAQHMVLQLNTPFAITSQSPLAACVGMVHLVPPLSGKKRDADLFLAQARFAMQVARNEGRNGIHLFMS
ncbi:adenylate/guanylate cyclase domain-containing protein [Brenneria roseae subsp. roseae]|uniref:diguanylate cyclase n=1 Tax=Brenneria roseae TaxID=1509241 RepID=UPI000D612901|nr:diguanylate cyclase [Brenneria roseae]PWC17560.1 adenylate/guanylate cyclase domain-containing protein [Brenneria roseae subsp. roseae]